MGEVRASTIASEWVLWRRLLRIIDDLQFNMENGEQPLESRRQWNPFPCDSLRIIADELEVISVPELTHTVTVSRRPWAYDYFIKYQYSIAPEVSIKNVFVN